MKSLRSEEVRMERKVVNFVFYGENRTIQYLFYSKLTFDKVEESVGSNW